MAAPGPSAVPRPRFTGLTPTPARVSEASARCKRGSPGGTRPGNARERGKWSPRPQRCGLRAPPAHRSTNDRRAAHGDPRGVRLLSRPCRLLPCRILPAMRRARWIAALVVLAGSLVVSRGRADFERHCEERPLDAAERAAAARALSAFRAALPAAPAGWAALKDSDRVSAVACEIPGKTWTPGGKLVPQARHRGERRQALLDLVPAVHSATARSCSSMCITAENSLSHWRQRKP